jgi:hypothetical protein
LTKSILRTANGHPPMVLGHVGFEDGVATQRELHLYSQIGER